MSGSSPPEDFVTEDVQYVDSVTIDFSGERLYWTDFWKQSIESVRLDGTDRRTMNIARKLYFQCVHHMLSVHALCS